MAGFAYRKAYTETDKAKIEAIIKGFNNSFILSNLPQVESISVLVPEEDLPKSFGDEMNEALRFTIEAYLARFPAGDLFVLEMPVFSTSAGVEPYYEINMPSATIRYHCASVRGKVEYRVFTLSHKGIEGAEIYLDDFPELKGKFTAILDSDDEKTAIAFAERDIHLKCAPKEGESLDSILGELLYETCHEAVHAVTMPDIIRKFYLQCGKELDKVLKHPNISEAVEVIAYSLGPMMFDIYRSKKGLPRYEISLPISQKNPGVKRSIEILKQSSSLEECHSLVQEELSKLLEAK